MGTFWPENRFIKPQPVCAELITNEIFLETKMLRRSKAESYLIFCLRLKSLEGDPGFMEYCKHSLFVPDVFTPFLSSAI